MERLDFETASERIEARRAAGYNDNVWMGARDADNYIPIGFLGPNGRSGPTVQPKEIVWEFLMKLPEWSCIFPTPMTYYHTYQERM